MLAKALAVLLLAGSAAAVLKCTPLSPVVTADYCDTNCNHAGAAFCPQSLCACAEGTAPAAQGALSCTGNGVADSWCVNNCNSIPSFCPAAFCTCVAAGSTTPTATATPTPTSVCVAIRSDISNSWCSVNCAKGFCPAAFCNCAGSTGELASVTTYQALCDGYTDNWCNAVCTHSSAACPSCCQQMPSPSPATASPSATTSPSTTTSPSISVSPSLTASTSATTSVSASASLSATASASATTSPSASPAPIDCQASPDLCTCANDPCVKGDYSSSTQPIVYMYYNSGNYILYGPYSADQAANTLPTSFTVGDVTGNPIGGPVCTDTPNSYGGSTAPFTCNCRSQLASFYESNPLNASLFNTLLPTVNFGDLSWIDDGYEGLFCETPVCFPGDATVIDASGAIRRMDELALGDRVQCIKDNGEAAICVVFAFETIVNRNRPRLYTKVTLTTHTIQATASHLVFRIDDDSFTSGTTLPAGTFVKVDQLSVGERMIVSVDGHYEAREIVNIQPEVYSKGSYAPLLMTEDNQPAHRFFVDDVLASALIGRSCMGPHEVTQACMWSFAATFSYFNENSPGYGVIADDLPKLLGWETEGNSPELLQLRQVISTERSRGNKLDPLGLRTRVQAKRAEVEAAGEQLTFAQVLAEYKKSYVPV